MGKDMIQREVTAQERAADVILERLAELLEALQAEAKARAGRNLRDGGRAT